MQSISEFFTKMFVFNASATRKQYWLPYFGIIALTVLVAWATGASEFVYNAGTHGVFKLGLRLGNNGRALTFLVYYIVVRIANFTLRARRLHDTNRSNWWIFIDMVPVIGQIWLFILTVLPSNPMINRWPVNQTDAE
jgi:uncharacterized membrane protein YhaH (DUF805 family)